MKAQTKKKYMHLFGSLSKTNKVFKKGSQFVIGNEYLGFDSFYCYKVEETEDKIIYYFND